MGVESDAEIKTFSTKVITALINEDKYQIKYERLKGKEKALQFRRKQKHLNNLQIQPINLY